MICHFKNLIYENILKVSIKICDSLDTRATALTRRRDKHTPLDQTRLKAEKKSDDGSGVAR